VGKLLSEEVLSTWDKKDIVWVCTHLRST